MQSMLLVWRMFDKVAGPREFAVTIEACAESFQKLPKGVAALSRHVAAAVWGTEGSRCGSTKDTSLAWLPHAHRFCQPPKSPH